jgi:DNA-binding MarR family transcriptional regulator
MKVKSDRPAAGSETMPDQGSPNIGLEVRYTMRAFTRVLSRIAEAEKLTSAQFRVLRSLEQGASISQVELAELTAMERPHVSILTKQLCEAGLVDSRPYKNDRRRTVFSLTRRGRAVCQRVSGKLDRVNTSSLDGIASDDLRALLECLARIRTNLATLQENLDPEG